MYVLDASVIIKWYVEEEDSDKAFQILDRYKEGLCEIASPDLLIYEVCNVLRYNPEFTEGEVKECICNLWSLDLDIIVSISEVVNSAISLAYENNISFYDALYVALAKEIGYTFITADEKMYKKIKDLGFISYLKDITFK